MGETREYVDGKDTESHGVAGCCTNIKQPCDEKKRYILKVVSVHSPGTFDIFVGQQLLRAWMRISGGPLRILLVAVPTSDLGHSEYGDPSLRHHLHDHQCPQQQTSLGRVGRSVRCRHHRKSVDFSI